MTPSLDLLSVNEAAKKYRKRQATVRSLCRLGKIKNEVRPGRGRTGKVTWIDAKDAARVLGIRK
jgi:hypothetical protein